MLVDKTVKQLLEAFASPAPTPGGGSAAALGGAVAAALLEMVAAMPKTRTGAPEERAALDAALPRIRELKQQLASSIDRDAASYDAVVAAFRMPKGSDDEKAARTAAIQAAMKGATEVPLETVRAAAELAALGRTVADNGNANARTDAAVAIELAGAAVSGGRMNVEINLDSVKDERYREAARAELARLTGLTGRD
jgi:formiminotetrahydrofolate cyclodeaminase